MRFQKKAVRSALVSRLTPLRGALILIDRRGAVKLIQKDAKSMRFSSCYIPTLKESPADAEVISHKLLLRAGMVRRLTSGLYIYLPLGLKVIDNIAGIVREEMNAAGFQELLMPMVQPADLWKETGRWEHYGKELLRFKDRNEREYCLGPTHEEVITDLVRGEVRSYRQLPVRLYQIQSKFRDEIRPRFGLMRGREFMMKDGYSFDADSAGAEQSYKLMYDAYTRIFSRLGLRFRAVEADTGSIGGNFSHEFMVLADTGEDTIAFCHDCDYAANVERAEVNWKGETCAEACPPCEKVDTPGAHSVEDVAKMLHAPAASIVKTMLFTVDGKAVAVLVRGDREVNAVKLKNLLKAQDVELAGPAVVEALTRAPVGFAGRWACQFQCMPIWNCRGQRIMWSGPMPLTRTSDTWICAGMQQSRPGRICALSLRRMSARVAAAALSLPKVLRWGISSCWASSTAKPCMRPFWMRTARKNL